MKKVSKVLLQVVIAEYDEAGDLIDEQVSQPVAIYRAKTPDLWSWIDREVVPQLPRPNPAVPRKATSKGNGRPAV